MDDRLHLQSLSDPGRLHALARTHLLDTGAEPAFDRIAELAAQLLGTPVALVSLVDEDRQFFKSCIGLPGKIRETPLSHSFCQYAVSRREALVVEDAREHPLLRENRAIEELGVVAYAGVPLVTRDGHVLGSLCAIDSEPREWSGEDVELLRTLAESVVALIELRQEAEEHRHTSERLREREARVRLMMKQLPVLAWSTDSELRFHGAEGLGLNMDALQGVAVQSYFASDPGVAAIIEAAHARALDGESVRYEVSWKDRHFDCRVEPLRGRDGSIEGVIGVGSDITERREAAAAREEGRRRFKGLVEHGSDIVALVRPTGIIEYESPSIQRVLGYDPAEVIGEPFHQFIHPDDVEETAGVFTELLEQAGSARSWRLRLRAADGDYRHLEAVAKNAMDIDSLGGVVFTARDITEEVQIQRRLDERQEQLVHSQKLDAMGRLAAGVAHDFNNLLTAVMAHVEFLREMVPAADAVEEIDGIADTADRAADLTRQLLAFSGEQATEPGIVDVGEVVRRLNRMLRRLIGEDITLVTRREPGLRSVWMDPARLEQVIVNLVVNARDAMPAGGELAIRIGMEGHHGRTTDSGDLGPGQYVVLEVEDQGVGMDAQTRSRIFEPFFTTKGSAGTGLGLATSFGIVTEAGGGIDVQSAPGQGTRFRVHLPVAAERSAAAETTSEPSATLHGSERVLLVEDDPTVRALTARVLEGGGYHVLQAGDADEAIGVADAQHIDLLVADVILPGESGPQLYDRLKEQLGSLPVLYVSGYPARKLQPHGVLGGQRRFLPKPFFRDDLLGAVRATLDSPA